MQCGSSKFDGVTVREATVGDGQKISAYVGGIVAEDLDTIPSRTIRTAEAYEAIIATTAPGERLFLIAMNGETVIGLLDLQVDHKRGRQHVGAFGTTVASHHRGRGIGRCLLELALAKSRSWPSVCRLELEVVPWNKPAIALYQSAGFEIEARKAKAINLRGEPEDILLMALVW